MPTTCVRLNCPNKPHPTQAAAGHCRKHAQATGLICTRTPLEPVARNIDDLIAHGWTREQIAAAADVSHRTVSNILTRATKHVETHAAARLTAITTTPPKPAFQPAWRATRRLRALRAAGHTVDDLAQETGLSAALISRLCTGRDGTITAHTWDAINTYYATHGAAVIRPITASIRRKRWLTPLMWDNIDDPDEKPDKPSRPLNSSRREITQDDRAAVARIYTHHRSWERLRRNTGLDPDALRDVLTSNTGYTATRNMLDRIHAADADTPTPTDWRDQLPTRGRPLRRPITDEDLANIAAAREALGSYNAVDEAAGLSRKFSSSAARGERATIRDAWADRIATIAHTTHTEETHHAAA